MPETRYPDTLEGRQLFYDVTVAHLKTMRSPAGIITEDSSDTHIDFVCKYLTPTGAKCAIGYHIPDGHPAQHFAGTVTDISQSWPELSGIAYPEGDLGIRLATRLQWLHDTAEHWGPSGFEAETEQLQIAEQYNLTRRTQTAATDDRVLVSG